MFIIILLSDLGLIIIADFIEIISLIKLYKG